MCVHVIARGQPVLHDGDDRKSVKRTIKLFSIDH